MRRFISAKNKHSVNLAEEEDVICALFVQKSHHPDAVNLPDAGHGVFSYITSLAVKKCCIKVKKEDCEGAVLDSARDSSQRLNSRPVP